MKPTTNRYAHIKKPSRAPPAWLFGPVRTFLYILIVISFGKVFLMAGAHQIVFLVVLPFILNAIFNLIFSPIQFGLKNNVLAAIDVILILATLIWATIAIYPYMHRVAYLQIPYLIWVCIATTLQLTVTYMNRK
ncbi:MAG: TspO/MBR family protein [bacterium]